MSAELTYLNLGCGKRYHPDWINMDIAPASPEVIQHDLSSGIPLADESCDVVYHAAVLEHMRRSDATAFLGECYRVLKNGGIIRIGVPDLERICRIYLSKLAAAAEGEEGAAFDYDWIMLELYDQAVREKSGGEMLEFLRQDPLANAAFIYERIGEEGRELTDALHWQRQGIKAIPSAIRKSLTRVRSLPGVIRDRLSSWMIAPDERRALEIGRFRLSGEVHQWMYDRYSLARLLNLSGFQNPRVCDASQSQIRDWAGFHLDLSPDGQVIKPDLFFMEATKVDSF